MAIKCIGVNQTLALEDQTSLISRNLSYKNLECLRNSNVLNDRTIGVCLTIDITKCS